MMGPACRPSCAVSCSSLSSLRPPEAPDWASTSRGKCAKRTARSSTTSKPRKARASRCIAERTTRTMSKSQVLVVDDEADIRELLGMTLTRMGLDAHCAGSTNEALTLLGQNSYELCLTDMRLPDGDGLAVLDYVSRHQPNMPVAVITAHGSAENAVAALKAGAFDYLAKPVSLNQLRALVRSALKLPRASTQRKADDKEVEVSNYPELLGVSALMEQTRKMIDRLARSQAPVHISGESGC